MSIFLRDLPKILQLNPSHPLQNIELYNAKHKCQTLSFQWQSIKFAESGYKNKDDKYDNKTFYRSGEAFGENTNVMDVHLRFITNSFGSLLISTFFNAVYSRFPALAINSLKQAYAFNHHLNGLFIIQALNRLAYAYFGLDYEDYRNKEDIKTRSIIEDFHSILVHVLVLPERDYYNEGEVWRRMPEIDSRYMHYTWVYDNMFINYYAYHNFITLLYTFTFKNKIILAPFFTQEKADLYSSYGEFRALRNLNDNSTYLYKTFMPQPQNCDYENIEIEKMKIESKINYKDIDIEVNPYSNWKELEEEIMLKKGYKKDHYTFYSEIKKYRVSKLPPINMLTSKIADSNNINTENLGFYKYPEELLELWKDTVKTLWPYCKADPEILHDENIYKLNHKENDNQEIFILLNEKIKESLKYIIRMHLWFRDRRKIKVKQIPGEPAWLTLGMEEREVEASLFISNMLEFFKDLGELEKKTEKDNNLR